VEGTESAAGWAWRAWVALFSITMASLVAVSVSGLHAWHLRGQWSAIVMIADAVIAAYTVVMLAWGLRVGHVVRRARQRRRANVELVGWAVLGPVPIGCVTVLHGMKMLGAPL